MTVWTLVIAWLLFAGSHLALAAVPIRNALVQRIGVKGFQSVYSLVAFATFGWLIYAYTDQIHQGGLWLSYGMNHIVVRVLSEILMVAAFALLTTGLINKNPMAMAPAENRPYGITRITRHPMNMAFALFGIAHLLVYRFAADWVFFGGFILYGFFGSWHQDHKKNTLSQGRLQAFLDQTSIVPFAAILQGRQHLVLAEISKIGLLFGVGAALAARLLHPSYRHVLGLG